MRLLRFFVTLALCLHALPLSAQFYPDGRGPMNLRWMQTKAPGYRLIYPDYFAPTAVGMTQLLDSIAPHIGYGFALPSKSVPILLYTENQQSNGMVVWAPKRMELVTTAPANSSADPWLEQLVIHESRHVAQISAMRDGLTKLASWLFGEAGMALGMIGVPKWFMEGDAVMAETRFSEFGRGLQPSFSVDLRALLMDSTLVRPFPMDKWVCGSYNQHIPDIYTFGYHMIGAGERHGGPNMWGEAVTFAAKWPVLLVPMRIYMKHHYGAHAGQISRGALRELALFWRPNSLAPDDYRTLTRPGRSYTTYDSPLPDGAQVIATKRDFDTPIRWVSIDTATLREQTLGWLSTPSSRPVLDPLTHTLYWTEYKPHPIWEYKNYSIIRSLDLQSGKRAKYGMRQANYFVTPLSGGQFATTSPDSLGGSLLILRDGSFGELSRYRFPALTTLHGLAWDAATQTLAFIAVDDRGMYLGEAIRQGDRIVSTRELTAPSMVTLSSLSADAGTLYFSSIASGKDEIHSLDLTRREEYQLTRSRFGAYTPSASGGELLFTTYTQQGRMVALGSTDTTGRRAVDWSRLPVSLLNMPIPEIGNPRMIDLKMEADTTPHRTGRYHKALRWFNVHSWAPMAVNLDDLVDDRNLSVSFGITAFFQSAMGDAYGSASYGRLNNDDWITGSFTYAGLPLQIGLSTEYGGGKQSVYIPSSSAGVTAPADLSNYLRVTGKAAFPLNLSGGANYRLLQPSFEVSHYNTLLYNPASDEFDKGYQKYTASVWWSNSRIASYRSITPRLGYALRADWIGAFTPRFGKLYSIYARGYLPGVSPNHSIALRTGYAYQQQADLHLTTKPLFPRGNDNLYAAQRYGAVSMDYYLPLCYPDRGIQGFLYFKRLSLDLFGDYAKGDYFTVSGTTSPMENWSAGGTFSVDVNVLSNVTPMRISITVADTPGKAYVGFGFSALL